jgi:hypothetical protein
MNKLIFILLSTLFLSCTPDTGVFRGKERRDYRIEQKRTRKPIINPLRMNT